MKDIWDFFTLQGNLQGELIEENREGKLFFEDWKI